MPRNWVIVALVGALTLSLVTIVTAQDSQTASVEVRVWQSTRDAESLYISARPEGGSWATLGTIPLDMSNLNDGGTYRYGDITVGVEVEGVAQPVPASTPTPSGSGPAPPPDPAPEPEPFTVNVEIRVWQSTQDAETLYISARPEDGDWSVLGTIPLDMSGRNSRGTYRYGDITVMVPVPGASVVTPEPEPTEEAAPWTDPRPDNTYSLKDLQDLSPPVAPTPPRRPDHVVALVIDEDDIKSHLTEVSRVLVSFTHTYRSREYEVVCDDYVSLAAYGKALCEYVSGPFNEDGTGRLSLYWLPFWDKSPASISNVRVQVDGVVSPCEERVSPDPDEELWWCWDPETYAAWERVRDEALEPATDPLERYLRNEDGPPLWYQNSPYAGEGRHTTGVMHIKPYVTYEVSRTYTGEYLTIHGLCAPIDSSSGQPRIHDDRTVEGPVGDAFTLRGTYWCEWTVVTDGEWTVTITQAE